VCLVVHGTLVICNFASGGVGIAVANKENSVCSIDARVALCEMSPLIRTRAIPNRFCGVVLDDMMVL
jgi:hypothetical protein